METAGITLSKLLHQAGIQPQLAQGSLEGVQVWGLCADSRQVQPGDLFLGMPGSRVDGGSFVAQALAAGAVAALISQEAWESVSSGLDGEVSPSWFCLAPASTRPWPRWRQLSMGFPPAN
jgi:UDP-N-acetylmuramoylalanyl-D-glutamate--2,6-diaminopimelate ligase (EC 6.3.2.13)